VELASQYAPPTLLRKATSIRSIPTPASTAALALTLAPLVQSLLANNSKTTTKQHVGVSISWHTRFLYIKRHLLTIR
jgi:hypothetical protein